MDDFYVDFDSQESGEFVVNGEVFTEKATYEDGTILYSRIEKSNYAWNEVEKPNWIGWLIAVLLIGFVVFLYFRL